MATVALSNTPTVIDLAEAITNWGGDTFATDADIKVQGNSSVACTQTNNGSNDVYVTGTWDFSTTDQHLRLWINSAIIAPYGLTEASDGVQIFLYDGTNTAYWTVSGSDTYAGGWQQMVVYTGNTATSGTVNKAAITRIGIRINTGSKPRNITNGWYDAWYYGDGYTITGGTSGDELDWSHVATEDKTNAYGIVSDVEGVYFLAGEVQIGDGTLTTYWKESGQICVFKDLLVLSTLYDITFFDDASNVTNVDITGGVYSASGTQDFTVDASITDINSFSLSGKQFSNASTIDFAAGETITNCVFDNCGQVDPSTSTFNNCNFSNYVGTTGAMLFPSNDSNISSLAFTNCDNGVEYDSASDATSPTFDDFTFDDEAGNYDVNNTSGAAVSISKNNGSNPNSYNPGGDTVTFLGPSVTTSVTVKDASTQTLITGARVLVWVTSTAAGFPYDATVTIAGTGTTATVTHSGHNLTTGDYIVIAGSTADEYNGVYQVTVTNTTTYTYDTGETVTTGTPGGTIKATFAFISGETSATGILTDTRVVPSDQPISGWVRKGTSSPYYIQGVIAGTVDAATGFSTTVQLVSDE